ncbi:MAG: DivIVA domain-containing protein [Bacillota bacterium]
MGSSGEDGVSVHRLTPLDIHNREFSKAFRGYSEDEVDEFLDLVVAEFEKLIRTNEELGATVSGLESRIEHYKGLEETLKNAIVLAQKTSDEIKEAAVREADVTKRQAMADADRIRDEANLALRKSLEEVEKQRNKLMRFRVELKTFLKSTLDMVDSGTERLLSRLDEPPEESTGDRDVKPQKGE